MKSKEEIEQLGSKYATTHEDVSDKLSKYLVSACFRDGYTQCQEDMKSLLLEIKDNWKGDKLLGGTYEKICNLLNKQD
jgi:hypothetical protein